MIYEFIIGIGTIIILSFFWTIMISPINTVTDSFKNSTNATVFGVALNTTDLNNNYDIAYNACYFSFFYIAIMIFIWIVKTAIEQQKQLEWRW